MRTDRHQRVNACEERILTANYRHHELPEYNSSPMIMALPPILSVEEFIEKVTCTPDFQPVERELESHHRFHCIERLSRYFEPLNKTIDLYQVICSLIMQGYLARSPLDPSYAQRTNQIYEAIRVGDGRQLDTYVDVPTSASGMTLIGPSGMGKSTNLIRILSLYPQVIFHPEYSVYQIVWLKVDCPHAGSLKGLCTDIFQSVDNLLGTDYFRKFGSRSNSEDRMLAQVAQIAHTHHLGLLVIDEIQNLVTAKRRSSDMLNFLVKMDNVVGVPVIRVGTNEAFPILQGNFRNARRGTGEGSVIWDRLPKGKEWDFFVESMWDYQWTKTPSSFTNEISEALYYESQGIIDVVVKLYKMVQWSAIALGDREEITVGLIREVAKDRLYLLKPMLDAIRANDKDWMKKYKDISPIDTTEYQNQCMSQLSIEERQEIQRLTRKKQSAGRPPADTNYVILELLKLEVEPATAKRCAEEVMVARGDGEAIESCVKRAYALALGGETSQPAGIKSSNRKNRQKLQQKFGGENTDIRVIVKKAQESETSAYEALKAAGIVKDDLIESFIRTE